ncbi:ZIP family zinc transporter [bacterium]|nr:MAG: ZIP family zinc transporter [bacterium]
MPKWLEAGFWGTLAGLALVLGAVIGIYAKVPRRGVALTMAFGAGVLVSALCFELMDEAYRTGGIVPAGAGFLLGAFVYAGANLALAKFGARHRKRSTQQPKKESDQPDSGTAILVGALVDGIPESIAIGLSLLSGGAVSLVAVIAIFLSNVPEGLSSSAGMRRSGQPPRRILATWLVIALVSGLASVAGYTLFQHAPPWIVAGTTAVAAGGILAMLADTMVPEAFDQAHDLAGLVTVLGFLLSFALSKSDAPPAPEPRAATAGAASRE